jgi:hypothetical protein
MTSVVLVLLAIGLLQVRTDLTEQAPEGLDLLGGHPCGQLLVGFGCGPSQGSVQAAAFGRDGDPDDPAVGGVPRPSDHAVDLEALEVAADGGALDPEQVGECALAQVLVGHELVEHDPDGHRRAVLGKDTLEPPPRRFSGEGQLPSYVRVHT